MNLLNPESSRRYTDIEPQERLRVETHTCCIQIREKGTAILGERHLKVSRVWDACEVLPRILRAREHHLLPPPVVLANQEHAGGPTGTK